MMGEANGGEDRRPRGEDPEHEDEEEERQGGEGAPPQRQLQTQRPASRPPSGPQPPTAMTRNVGYVGKHRLSAAIARLDQELQSLQEELNELETMEPASTACQDTSGPENSSWDRWFQRVRSSRSNKWWASRGSDFS
ncbi:guanine nucleotide-binding protein subunit gamma 2-like [Panicum miliaceum]|uniref:Guanine nucleotide-binding protein subunit gamma 2-like n=1 Tax=Panicum miliaceum TaxID=4540 RepID=A0A3L6RMR2_PANMI|nr:guanine nucleotide-binding protein subunit gamma 2-like [Panicum miliaceum]